jgi:hypothetical protein
VQGERKCKFICVLTSFSSSRLVIVRERPLPSLAASVPNRRLSKTSEAQLKVQINYKLQIMNYELFFAGRAGDTIIKTPPDAFG